MRHGRARRERPLLAGVAAGALFLVAAVVALLFIVGARGFDTSRAGSVFDDVKGFFAIGNGGREKQPAQGVLGATRNQARGTGEAASLGQLFAGATGGNAGGGSPQAGRGSDRRYADVVERLLALLRADDEEFAAALDRLRALLRGAPNHRMRQLDRAIRRRARQLARRGETEDERLELARLDAVASVVREEIERRALTRERRAAAGGEGRSGRGGGERVADTIGEGPGGGSPKARARSESSPRKGNDDDGPQKESKDGEKRDAGTGGGDKSGDDERGEGEGKKKRGDDSKDDDGDRDGSSRDDAEDGDREGSNEDEREDDEREEPEREDDP